MSHLLQSADCFSNLPEIDILMDIATLTITTLWIINPQRILFRKMSVPFLSHTEYLTSLISQL